MSRPGRCACIRRYTSNLSRYFLSVFAMNFQASFLHDDSFMAAMRWHAPNEHLAMNFHVRRRATATNAKIVEMRKKAAVRPACCRRPFEATPPSRTPEQKKTVAIAHAGLFSRGLSKFGRSSASSCRATTASLALLENGRQAARQHPSILTRPSFREITAHDATLIHARYTP